MGKTVEQQHEDLVKRYNRQEGQKSWRYPGYVKGSFLYNFGLSDDVLTIEPTDSKDDISRKNRLLRDMSYGSQKMIAIPKADEDVRYISERRWKEADKIQSEINYERYKVYQATATLHQKFKTKDSGTTVYKQVDYMTVPGAYNSPDLPGLPEARVFSIQGVGRNEMVAGLKIPKGLSSKQRKEYEKWVNNYGFAPKYMVESNKITGKFTRLFRGKQYEINKQERLTTYKYNVIKAIKGVNSVYRNPDTGKFKWGYKKKVQEISKRLSDMSNKDFFLFNAKYSENINFGFIYSENDIKDKLDLFESYLDRFEQIKREGNTTEEGKAYIIANKQLGNYYD